jgi:dienelactone hydrolase
MISQAVLAFVVVFGTVTLTQAADTLTFAGKTYQGDPLILTGKLTRPQGQGPFPAVVMLNHCEGMNHTHYDIWAERLASWGYLALQVDSFGPRGKSDVCEPGRHSGIDPLIRVKDAYDAKSFLAGLPFVDRNRIAVVGWGHGGWTTFYAVNKGYWVEDFGSPFRSAIAFYPWCSAPLSRPHSPLLILIGEVDEAMAIEGCRSSMPSRRSDPQIFIKVYSGVYHQFDQERPDRNWGQNRLRYDATAAEDSITRVREFLTKYME